MIVGEMSAYSVVFMTNRSKGFRSATRMKFTKHVREHGAIHVNRVIQDLRLGAKVVVVVDSSTMKGQPHGRYQGRVGVVAERRGRAYVVEVRDGGTIKKIISRPEHLKVVAA
jgi:large subunit ribosomal protein L21e